MFRLRVRDDVDLRLLEERHAPTVFAMVDRHRKYLREWLPWIDATISQDDTLSFIRSSLERFSTNHGFSAGIWTQEHFSGVIGTHNIDWVNRKVEIGYWLDPSIQGCGIVTDSCRALVTYVLAELDLNRVEIHCGANNEKSCAVPKRLGFKLEGTLREGQFLNGRYYDLLVFGMLKKDWKVVR
jgi:ribosomal-protein-serine acetyltransferase